MIRENERQLNNKEVCETLNRQERTILDLQEDAYKHLQHIKRQNLEIAMLRKELRETKKKVMKV